MIKSIGTNQYRLFWNLQFVGNQATTVYVGIRIFDEFLSEEIEFLFVEPKKFALRWRKFF